MGYYTTYNLSIVEGDDYSTDYQEEISKQLDFDPFQGECKWYDNEEDMLLYSKNHPQVLFLLEGEGEEATDLWQKYFKNGKMQRCEAKITYDPFDETKLK